MIAVPNMLRRKLAADLRQAVHLAANSDFCRLNGPQMGVLGNDASAG